MMLSLVFTGLLMLVGASHGAAEVKHVVEVYFVVEPQVVRNYMKLGYSKSSAISTIKGDIEYFIYEVNQLYKSMEDYKIYIEVRQKALKIFDTSEDLYDDCKLIRGTDLQADIALEVFKEWLKKTNAKTSIGYDIALVWTGFDLFSSAGNNQVTGYATTRAACHPDVSVAVVEFDGTYDTALTTAHEIGHSLGSPHDQNVPCSPRDGYIMTPIGSALNPHRWEFSSCSIKSIVSYINTLSQQGNNCLIKTTTPKKYFHLSSQSHRDILDPQKICQRAKKDKDSYFCTFDAFYGNHEVKGDGVCKKLMCGKKGSTSCLQSMPSEGMICDKNKRCENGRCVTATFATPPSVHEHCVFGDIQSDFVNGKRQTCTEFLLKEGGKECYIKNVAEMCCNSCGKIKTNIFDCLYGDRSNKCHDYTLSQLCHGQNNIHACCATCNNYVTKRSFSNETLPLIELPHEPLTPIAHYVEEEADPKLFKGPVSMH